MKKWFLLFSIPILGFFQVTVLSRFQVFGVKPDLLLIGVVITSVLLSRGWALLGAFLAGMFKDVFLVDSFAVNTMLFVLWSLVLNKVSRKVIIDDRYALMAVVFIAVFINNLIIRFILLSCGKTVSLGIFSRITIISAVYSAALLPLMYAVLKYLPVYKRR